MTRRITQDYTATHHAEVLVAKEARQRRDTARTVGMRLVDALNAEEGRNHAPFLEVNEMAIQQLRGLVAAENDKFKAAHKDLEAYEAKQRATVLDAQGHYLHNQAAYQEAALEDAPAGVADNFEKTHEEQLEALRRIHDQEVAQSKQ